MLTLPVPDYFQEDSEDALRSRVQWLQAEVNLGNAFFAKLLRTDEATFLYKRARICCCTNPTRKRGIGVSLAYASGWCSRIAHGYLGWKERRATLPRGELLGLRQVWDMMIHVLSFVNFDSGRARRLLEHVQSGNSRHLTASQVPPWAGSSIKMYLETHGPGGVDDVHRWVTSFRFGAPSLTPEHEMPCPSSQD